jgi:hypothetical protein
VTHDVVDRRLRHARRGRDRFECSAERVEAVIRHVAGLAERGEFLCDDVAVPNAPVEDEPPALYRFDGLQRFWPQGAASLNSGFRSGEVVPTILYLADGKRAAILGTESAINSQENHCLQVRVSSFNELANVGRRVEQPSAFTRPLPQQSLGGSLERSAAIPTLIGEDHAGDTESPFLSGNA